MAGSSRSIQLVPATLFAPFASVLADRHRPALVLTLGYVAQGVAMGATAARPDPRRAARGSPTLRGGRSDRGRRATRPTMAVLTPALARTPEELTAANVVSGWNESVSVLVAPAVAGLLIARGRARLGVPRDGGGSCSAALPSSCRIDGPAAGRARRNDARRAELVEGFRVVAVSPRPGSSSGCSARSTWRSGCSTSSTSCSRSRPLGMGQGGAGYLNAAFGAGGALGIAVTASLVGRARLMPAVVVSLGVWAAAFALMAVWSEAVGALLLLAVAGRCPQPVRRRRADAAPADGARGRARPRVRHPRGADHGRDGRRSADRAAARQPRRRRRPRSRRRGMLPLLALLGGRRLLCARRVGPCARGRDRAPPVAAALRGAAAARDRGPGAEPRAGHRGGGRRGRPGRRG